MAGGALTGFENDTMGFREVFYFGANSHLYHFWSIPANPWLWEDLTGQTGATAPIAGSSLTAYEDIRHDYREIFYVGTDQHVYHFWSTPGIAWAEEDLTNTTGAPLVGSGSVLTGFENNINDFRELYFAGVDQVLYHFWGTPDFGWGLENITSEHGTPSLVAGSSLTSFAEAGLTIPIANLSNLTHPSWGTSFAVGDTFQVTILGAAPNKPVYVSGSSAGTVQLGQTDGSGRFSYTAVEQTSNIGSYTEVFSVGSVSATPAISFLVGQVGGNGTIATTDVGQIPDGSLTGVSSLSITNGVVSTYSSTSLDTTASLYYNSETVATLFDNANAIRQNVVQGSIIQGRSSATTTLTANGNAWDDYDLQTDHYAIAFLVSGSYYENPLNWGDSCDADSGDCTIGGGGGYAFWVTAELIYVGSTLADQANVPQNGAIPAFPDNLYNNFLNASGQQTLGPIVFKSSVVQWFEQLAAMTAAIGLTSSGTGTSTPPVPFMVDLEPGARGDEYVSWPSATGTARQRAYILRDFWGRSWSTTDKVIVGERFSNPLGGQLPDPEGLWYAVVPNPKEGTGVAISGLPLGEILDHYSRNGAPVGFLQYYYAYQFTVPSWLSLPGLSLPGLPSTLPGGTGGVVVPLWIHDAYNSCETALGSGITLLPAQPIYLGTSYVGVDGDNGPPPAKGCRPAL